MSLPVVSDSLQNYLVEINRYPVLSKEEEFEVAERYYRLQGLDDAHKLVVSNLRYVVKIALEFRNYGCRLSDLIQEGNIGLMVAVKKFNPLKGFRLITYATLWIKSFIQDFILKNKGLVRRGGKALKKKLFYRNSSERPAIAENTVARRSTPDDSGHAGFDFSNDLSLDANIADGETAHRDMLRDLNPGPVETVSAKEELSIVKREVKGALALLNDKERVVVETRLMSDEPESLQAVGDKLGLTRERVRQIEGAAIKKLRKTLAEKLTPEFEPEPA
ncbi:MAG: sigma-70 family RNA polymerase sigma factor [Deltaproteobacteria bacterium]|nr:sigma-70 family RNA polymerase sigma factor [Deltaproteobacteria bacterium]